MDRFAGKILFVQKEPLKTAFLGWQKWTLLSLGGAGGQTVHNRSTFGAPLKTYGHNASNELCGRSVASKLWPQQADGLFYQGETEIGENLHFFYKTVCTLKFSTWKLFGGRSHGIVTHSRFRICVLKGSATHFRPCYSCPRSGEGGKNLPAKSRRCNKKLHSFKRIFMQNPAERSF